MSNSAKEIGKGNYSTADKHFAARQSHWFRVKGNKLAEHWATREDLPVLVQLGVIKLPGTQVV
ncbi:MAG: hypothetical protein EYC68_12270 [Chloroflexota bacterium]|nr:MAG: hypothetical protein EYC68_12270 [Chloroflexota bacterium]